MPTGVHSDREIEDVYPVMCLYTHYWMRSAKNKLIVMGEFNAVVREGADENVVGGFGLVKIN